MIHVCLNSFGLEFELSLRVFWIFVRLLVAFYTYIIEFSWVIFALFKLLTLESAKIKIKVYGKYGYIYQTCGFFRALNALWDLCVILRDIIITLFIADKKKINRISLIIFIIQWFEKIYLKICSLNHISYSFEKRKKRLSDNVDCETNYTIS